MSKQQTKKIALALQGGGSHGAFTWGVLDRFLEDERFEIEGMSGTSAGAMNALAFTQGFMNNGAEGARKSLHDFWNQVSAASFFSPLKSFYTDAMVSNFNLSHTPMYVASNLMQNFFSPYETNPLNLNPLRDVLNQFFDFHALSEYHGHKIFICATHVRTGQLRIFQLHEISVDVLLASACLPTLFHAVEIDGEHYWDGGFVGNPAIYPLIDGCDTADIAIVQLTKQKSSKLPTSAYEITERYKEIGYNSCLMREMRAIHLISTLIEKGYLDSKHIKHLNMHLIRDAAFFENIEISSALNADWNFLQQLHQAGRRTAAKWIDQNFEYVGKKSSVNIEEDFVDFSKS